MTAEIHNSQGIEETYRETRRIGGKSESYEDIIWRLIENKNENVDIEAVQRLRRQIEVLVARFQDLASQGADKNSKK